jgi:hypothetical protein
MVANMSLPQYVRAQGLPTTQDAVVVPAPTGNLLYEPVSYNYQDVAVPNTPFGNRQARLYVPSMGTIPSTTPFMRAGSYPLVVFCHGSRFENDGTCPAGISHDFQRWPRLLSLLARCGFVVASIDARDSFDESGARLIESVVQWLRTKWEFRSYLRSDAGKISTGSAPRSYTALIAHSWSTRSVNALLVRNIVRPDCVAFANGTWDSPEPLSAIYASLLPILLIAGSTDLVPGAISSTASAVYGLHAAPKYLAVIQGAEHWAYSDIKLCNPSQYEVPPNPAHAAIASDLLAVFLYKYLYKQWYLPPNLQTSYGTRPNLASVYGPSTRVALAVRWDEPFTTSTLGKQGETKRGVWVQPVLW